MSYKYDRENGYRNADTIGADKEEFNPELSNIIDSVKKASNVREAINIVSCEEKRRELYNEEVNKKMDINIKREQEQEEKQYTSKELIEDIKKDLGENLEL